MWRAIKAWLGRKGPSDAIRRSGWVLTHVGVGDLGFAYTTGFMEDAGSPEIIMFGVRKADAMHMARQISLDLQTGALVLTDGGLWPPEESQKVMFRKVHATQMRREYFNVAISHRLERGLERDGLEAFQVVWPDPHGVFPWEPAFDKDYRPRQLALYGPYEGAIDEAEALEVFRQLDRNR